MDPIIVLVFFTIVIHIVIFFSTKKRKNTLDNAAKELLWLECLKVECKGWSDPDL